ncbi:hypothetical protein [Rhizobium grahamii]|uniref:Uncharacterized protein n=1 Tax=Rhizobium grahamii CCGE 502 TaxID=990285 RepID=S3HH62_9HYPH|nr:hypothetical protein [Rhizobium grahamii]EPE97435.1 hypothetical protein RGCCGE502_15370 [Rhizobium grahamii CCGE 502]
MPLSQVLVMMTIAVRIEGHKRLLLPDECGQVLFGSYQTIAGTAASQAPRQIPMDGTFRQCGAYLAENGPNQFARLRDRAPVISGDYRRARQPAITEWRAAFPEA